MKKLLVIAVMLMFTASCFAAVVNTRVTGNVVSFSSVSSANARHVNVVTFNSVTKRIRLLNLSTVADCYVDLKCGDIGNASRKSSVVLVPAMGRTSPNTVEVDFATRYIGFCGDTADTSSNGGVSGSNQKIHYTILGDAGDL